MVRKNLTPLNSTLALAIAAAAICSALAQPAAISAESTAASDFNDFQNFAPHRAFVVGLDGKGYWWAAASGRDPGGSIEKALARCAEKVTPDQCVLRVVNNYT